MDVEFDDVNKTQAIVGQKQSSTPDLIWICAVVKTVEQHQRDVFYILTERDIHKILVNNYREMLEKTADIEREIGSRLIVGGIPIT